MSAPTGHVVRTRAWLDQRRRTTALWLFLAAPLVFLPGGFDRFVPVKLLFVALASLVACRAPGVGRLPRSILVTLAAGLIAFVVAALAGDTPWASLVGRWPRYEGVPTLALYAASLALGAHLVGRGSRRLPQLTEGVAVIALVLAAASILDVAGVELTGATNLDRSGSLLGNATDQGLVAMMAALVVAPRAITWRPGSSGLPLAGLLASLATVAISGSRTSLALTAVGLLVVAAAQSGAQRQRLLAWATGATTALGGLALALPATRDRLADTASIDGRLLQWRLTLDMVADRPWLGWGPSRYVDVFGRYETREWVGWAGSGAVLDSPHNVLLQLLVAGGIPLLLAGVALTAVAGRAALRVVGESPEWTGVAVAVAAYGIAMLANFTIAGSTCLAAFLAGVLLATPPREQPATPWLRPTLMGAAGLTTIVLAATCIADVHLQSGVEATAAGRTTAAVSSFDSATGLRPWDADTAMLGAQALAQRAADDQDQIAAVATRRLAADSLARTPETYASRLADAVAALALDDLTGAKAALDALVADYPYRPSARVQRAIARFGMHDLEGARADLEFAIGLDPSNKGPRRVLRAINERVGAP